MPVLLDDIDLTDDQTTTVKTVDPKFFSSKLTGNGKAKYGLLSPALNPEPSTINTAMLADAAATIEAKSTTTQHGISVTTIPMTALIARALTRVEGEFSLPTPEIDDRCVIETGSTDLDFAFALTPQGAKHYEDTATGDKKLPREFIVQYRMELYAGPKGQALPERTTVRNDLVTASLPGGTEAVVTLDWTTNPLTDAAGFVEDYLSHLNLRQTNVDALADWMVNDFNVHDAIVGQAEKWVSHAIADEVCAYIAGIPADPTDEHLNMLALQLRYLENYTIPLESYGVIHRTIEATFSDHIALTLSKQNLNLLMSHTLHQLDAIKPQLAAPVAPANQVPHTFLSKQQLEAVNTVEPLVMATAGAGTGKSTVILERIKFLESCGVPASDITVLSFTNIAADNITAKNPDVGSMTIARMINDIYTLNHPTHELSSIDTIINSLEIFYPTSPVADQFRSHLLAVDSRSKKVGAFTALNTFIENHYDEVMSFLDRIKQTSLELEIIVCYQKIDEMIEPPHVACKYLIIDEVQDNSIFEFVYLLKFVTKHQQSLFIVGDASQTLFEFRSANPRALTTLEGSGVFATYKLTTNYRSNQEILDFANVLLGGLETNQISNIQLQANSLDIPTADSFKKAVTLDYRHMPKTKGFVTDELPSIIKGTVLPKYVDDALARGEQTAFLAFSRREVALFEQVLAAKYPDKHLVNLVMERQYPTDIFSKYIKFFWNDVLQVQPHDASFTVAKGIKDNLPKLTNNAGNDKVQKAIAAMVSKWWTENAATIRGWEQMVLAGKVSFADFFEQLRDNLLSFEIHHNAVRQSLVQQKNRDRKEKNAEAEADLIVSTVHGAKGMEFDNVVVVHKEDPQMSEDVKRLYYVAFTRAKKSEYVLSYGKPVDPPIVSSYELIVDALEHRDKQARAQSMGITVEELDEIESNTTDTGESPVGGPALAASA